MASIILEKYLQKYSAKIEGEGDPKIYLEDSLDLYHSALKAYSSFRLAKESGFRNSLVLRNLLALAYLRLRKSMVNAELMLEAATGNRGFYLDQFQKVESEIKNLECVVNVTRFRIA